MRVVQANRRAEVSGLVRQASACNVGFIVPHQNAWHRVSAELCRPLNLILGGLFHPVSLGVFRRLGHKP